MLSHIYFVSLQHLHVDWAMIPVQHFVEHLDSTS